MVHGTCLGADGGSSFDEAEQPAALRVVEVDERGGCERSLAPLARKAS
jgi:hypothetical protein